MPRSKKHLTCIIAGCERAADAGDICNTHYVRRRKGFDQWDGLIHPREQKACRGCGFEFTGSTRALYCSELCKRRAKEERRNADPARRKHRLDSRKARSPRYVATRRARALASVPFTLEQLGQKMTYWGNKCWMCRKEGKMHVDHVKPLAKGGPHMLANLRPACHSCNSRKNAKWPLEPLKPSRPYTGDARA